MKQQEQREQYYTINAAASFLSVEPRTIYNYLKSGKLTRYKVNWQTLIKKDEVHKLATPQPEEAA